MNQERTAGPIERSRWRRCLYSKRAEDRERPEYDSIQYEGIESRLTYLEEMAPIDTARQQALTWYPGRNIA